MLTISALAQLNSRASGTDLVPDTSAPSMPCLSAQFVLAMLAMAP